jgi:hypothetical protein
VARADDKDRIRQRRARGLTAKGIVQVVRLPGSRVTQLLRTVAIGNSDYVLEPE